MIESPALNDDLTNSQLVSLCRTISFRTKCVIAFCFSLAYLLYRLLYQKYEGDICKIDKYHEITYEANRKLYHGWDNTIIGIGQLLMDGWVVYTGLYWFWNVKNMRFPSSIGVYFVFRALLLNLQKFPFPEDIVWHNPGFLSLSVPYDHTRDFFYSGHTGTLTIIALQFWTLKRNVICIACLVSLVYMVNMLTITRIHYSIDILGALIFAPFWFRIISLNLSKFDYGFSIFYLIGRRIFRLCKKSEYNSQASQVQIQTQGEPSNKQQSTTKNDKQLDMNEIFKDQIEMPYLQSGSQRKQNSKIQESKITDKLQQQNNK